MEDIDCAEVLAFKLQYIIIGWDGHVNVEAHKLKSYRRTSNVVAGSVVPHFSGGTALMLRGY